MSWDPDAAIFPRFRALSLYTLLGLQAEIWQLQEELDKFITANASESGENLRSTNWETLLHEEASKEDGQLATIMKLRAKLLEYSMIF